MSPRIMDACLLSLQVREAERKREKAGMGTARIPGDRKLALISAPMFAEQKAAGASGSGRAVLPGQPAFRPGST